MSNNEFRLGALTCAALAILLGALTYGGLIVATGKIQFFGIPEDVAIPLYILLYSFLGGVAYVLSALLGEYKLLTDEEHELEALKEKKLEIKDELPEELKRELERIQERLEKLKGHKWGFLDFWIKLARIPFGMLMASAFYLVANYIISDQLLEASGPKLLAGGAFLVAFFPKVMMEGFNGLANRLMGRTSSESGESSGR